MPKPEQILSIEPPLELKFVGPFTNVVTTQLRLKNPTNKNVIYKVRTTAPMRYCVRPNSGLVLPQEEVSITLSLQPIRYDPNEKTADKFMVMSMYAPQGPLESTEDIWKAAPPNTISDTKLKCVFVMPQMTEGENIVASPQPLISSPSSGDSTHVKEAGETPRQDAKEIYGTVREDNNSAEAKSDNIPREEVSHLLSELERLRAENKKLSDERMRLRNVSMPSPPSEESPKMRPHVNTFQNESWQNLPPIVYLMLVLLVGIIIGKLVL